MRHYHNTTQEASNLVEYQIKAASQDQKVLEYLKSHCRMQFTCEHISQTILPNAPITSARRAVTNLYNAGYLEKVRKIKGQYGRPIYLWRLKMKPGQAELDL